jgi:hypothetical protein
MTSEVIHFTETANEELHRLYDELQISKLVEALHSGKIPQNLQDVIIPLTTTIVDLFGTATPAIGIDPIEALKAASRDINLSRILRERGLFRLYRLLNTDDGVTGQPLWKSLTDPDTDMEFNRREDMIGWFCRSAKVSRSVVFMRMATIEKLCGLGFTLDEAYQTILTKPYAIRETLNEVAEWHNGELDFVDTDIALRLAEKFLPMQIDQVKQLVDQIESGNDRAQDELTDMMRPAIRNLVKEIATHEHTMDAMDFVRNDIAGKPEINYSWNYEKDMLIAEVIIKGRKNGTDYIKDIQNHHFFCEELINSDLRTDIIIRLPIKNRMREE